MPDVLAWRRVPGPKACQWCRTIAGQLYKTSETADFGHARCDCVVVPVRRDGLPADTQVLEEVDRSPSGLSTEQLRALAPDSQWSEEKRNLILEALRSTDEGRILADTLDKFQDGGSIARLRSNIEKRLAGETLDKTSAARADAIIDALRAAPTDIAPEKLYRGMSLKGKFDNIAGKYTPGDNIDLNLTSFTSDRKIAVNFQKMTASKGSTRVMVELVGEDKHLLPIQNLARDRRLFKEKEWVGGGRYEILETKKAPDGALIVRIRQAATL